MDPPTIPQNNAQNATSLLGKMLRIDVNVPLSDPNGYIVPSTNPFVQSPAGTNFRSGVLVSTSPDDSRWHAVGVCDLDLDGSPDIVFQHVPSGDVAAWYLNAETFRFGTYLSPKNVSDSNWKLTGPR